MFECLERLYNVGRLDEQGLQKALDRGWITQDEFDSIINAQNNRGENVTALKVARDELISIEKPIETVVKTI